MNSHQKMKTSSFIFTKISKTALYLAFFLTPLFFLPFTQNVLNSPKQILLLGLVLLSSITWLISQVGQKKIILRGNKLFSFVLLLVLGFFSISTFLSVWPSASFWGWPLGITDSFVTIFSFLLLVFLSVNVFTKEKEIFFAIFLLLTSGVLTGVFLIFQLYGIFILPFDFSKIISFNTLGSVYQAGIFFAVLLPISLVLAFRIKKPIFYGIFSILLALVILIDFGSAWLVLLFGILTLTILGLSDPQGKIKGSWAGVLMGLLVLSFFFLLFPLRFTGFPELPIQVSPGIVSEGRILTKVYQQGIKNALFGSGPGTFIFDYSKHRSPLLNQTIFWGTRFSSGSSEFLDWFITKGALAGFSLLFLLGLAIYFGIKHLTEANDYRGMKIGFLSSAVALFGAGFLSPFSFTLWFIFWVVIAGLLFYNSREIKINLVPYFRRTVFSGIFLAIIIFGLFLLFFQTQKYLGEVYYTQGIKFVQKEHIDQGIKAIQKATLLNPKTDVYWQNLAQLYLAKANLIAQDQELSAERKWQLVQENISNGVKSLNQAITLAPFNVANWNVRGFFYRSLIGIENAGEIALESYRRASELEPASPFPYGEMGRVYILMAQNFRKEKMIAKEKEFLDLAVENLQKAINLKSDYAPAHYLMAVAYDQQGRGEEAIAKLEDLQKAFPQDIGISFQLGMLYWRKERIEQAQGEFEKVVKLNPNYSNALYMLGLVYDKKGEKEKAIKQFEKVLELNPKNQEVEKILENLKKGLSALEGITPSQPPIGSTPPEIQR